jgi:hypothetical protein
MKRLFLFTFLVLASISYGQGMPVDSLKDRLTGSFNEDLFASLRDALPIRFDAQRVWGLAIGDFSSDGKPDLAISLYDISVGGRQVTVHLLQNEDGKTFKEMFRKKYSYIETPIEVGLASEGYILYVVQKPDDNNWIQEGYTIYAGDVITLDEFETRKVELGSPGSKAKPFGYELYRSYESLMTTEKYFDMKNSTQILSSRYYSFPAYSRLRNVYPGYGKDMFDTSTKFIVKGGIHRKDDKDLSIEKGLAAYDDEYIYYSIQVNDDQVWGGNDKMESNDRVALWFDIFAGDNRYVAKAPKGGVPTFRTNADSTIFNIIFSMPDIMSRTPKLTISTVANLTDAQQEASKLIRGLVERDTMNKMVSGYTLKVRIPFAFLGLEANPINAYESRAAENVFDDKDGKKKKLRSVRDFSSYPRFGFTAVAIDVDDPNLPDEITMQATSDFRPNDPSSYGELLLVPTGDFYGAVTPTYLKELSEDVQDAGY